MRITVGGDCLFSSRNLAERLDPKIVSELKNSDAAFANAEFTCPKPDIHPPAAGRGYVTSVTEDTLDEFVDLNIRLVNFANNHSGDFGTDGVVNTINAARERKLIPVGIGKSLDEAVLAKFLDTAHGRVGVVATSSTRSEVMLASNSGNGTVARPGVAPLRWGRSYVLPADLYKNLQKIDEALGTAASFRQCNEVEIQPPFPDGHFKLGSMFEGSLDIERGDHAHVKTYFNEKDAEALLTSIKDSSYRSDFNFVSLHTHEGLNNNWYDPVPAEFVQDFARKAIDNGADAVVGHGAHFMRGVEIYKGKPILYNIGSLLMEFETGCSLIPPEMYEAYGFPANSRPSDLHRNRANDPKTGKFRGFNANTKFSRNALAIFDSENGKISFKLLPIDLDMTRQPRMQRGIPYLVDSKVGHEISDYLTKVSSSWGTKLEYNDDTGYIELAN
ncbi:hypothetical protein FOA43_000612 [Brettanomyces nanus]|uniref:Capsule synthesis protein CapA domain-containing protein n=1 Tax=Eeniella nana TaxID=13502 RepID=A0A875RZI4_EENNA|nr:uncharacterized protein FOA43_000612 [Brettanomyces nanus]QPG73302.1 hypothetical protein FOA43_000612 [Brettanomyces nanus]